MIYRIIGGIGIGIASMLSPLYIAEIAPPAQRGQLVTYQQIAIVSGMTLVYFVNWAIAAQGDDAWVLSTGWRYMLLSGALPAALFLLLASRGSRDAALARDERPQGRGARRAAAADERRGSQSGAHRHRCLAVTHQRQADGVSAGSSCFVGVMLSIFQQFVGINAVLYYAPLMFKNMGASTDASLLQTIIVGVANIVFTLVALVTVDRWGRKPLLILGAVMMAVSMLTLGTLFHTGHVGTIALVAVVAYIGGFALSWGPVVWVLLAGDLPQRREEQGDGAGGFRAVGGESVRVGNLQGARRQFRAERAVQSRLRVLDLRRHERAGRAVRDALRARNQGPHARSHPATVGETGLVTSQIIDHLPADWRDALLLGRLQTREGPTPILVSGGRVRGRVTHRARPSPEFLELWGGELPPTETTPDLGPLEQLPLKSAYDVMQTPRLLAPIDLQCIKASGVTFAISAIERVIEERARGDAARAEEVRASLEGSRRRRHPQRQTGIRCRTQTEIRADRGRSVVTIPGSGNWPRCRNLYEGADPVVGRLGRLGGRACRFGVEQP